MSENTLSENLKRNVNYPSLLNESARVPNATEMYVRIAGEVLNQLSITDGNAAQTLRQIVDYLVSDARLNPEEIYKLRQ